MCKKRFFSFFPDTDYTHKDYLWNVKRLFGLVLQENAHMAFVADSAIGVHLIITRFIRRYWRSNNYRRLPWARHAVHPTRTRYWLFFLQPFTIAFEMIKKGEPDLVSSCLCLKIVNSPPMCELHRPGEIYRWRPWKTGTPQKILSITTTWRLQYDTKRRGPGLAYYLRPPCFDFPRLCFPSLNPPSGKTNTRKVHEHPF